MKSKQRETMKKLVLIIASVILFAACETNHSCECKYSYWGFTGYLIEDYVYSFKSFGTPCEDFEGKEAAEELNGFDHTVASPYYECIEAD